MAAELIVKLYEYSPLFYISLISICFILTVALVLSWLSQVYTVESHYYEHKLEVAVFWSGDLIETLPACLDAVRAAHGGYSGWFGFDVPVIVRSSDEGESLPPAPEKKMVQVLNPFALETGTSPGTVRDGVCLRPYCLEESVLSCFWGCNVQALQMALHKHRYGTTLNTAAAFHQALRGNFVHRITFPVSKEQRAEFVTQIPPDLGVTDFGLLPRDCYPLVAVLTLATEEDRDAYGIVASVTVLHVPDEKYRLSERILFHYLLTAAGNIYDLKPLFMSTDNTSPAPTSEETESHTNKDREAESDEEEEAWSGAMGKDCVVCQNAPLNRVLLPCRHACVCDECVLHFQHCPICRGFVCASFALSAGNEASPEAL